MTIPCVPTTITPCGIAATALRSSTVTSNELIERARSSTISTAPTGPTAYIVPKSHDALVSVRSVLSTCVQSFPL